ncbi:MAG: L-serine ammonia-lyase, iron-sulfur-dependent, subunit alpha [Lachnospiraceae bacterium]|jgi:L-serine dehydratase|nr:L-serine ammonia-lyase, iron-sulfur-dependent, subunit alpha [Lachnospiraceae bacterium]MCH4030773.1 L-serine ammonia-lyase, iron-sulfur-dependent, subunit alpha [Lachnospiraceae bacterium]MCH4070745.1 L-serine ammonia-lyase, iron-sulfur-dependent, subunit alpha [Lachnospiraceae bacterium]MCH4107079.1 L-serine ammonia-lyase, iron-sulfur-dependent, subunit alpha [Lachnospiraceae bacterium]MCI1302065.1 L-serine ammonia-lyase, iron-sulfur-dependent, subunit alpha [Lachnospiraceae bacterium]
MYDSFASLESDEKSTGLPLWKLIQQEDCAENGQTPEASYEEMAHMYGAMKDEDADYDPRRFSNSGLVGDEAGRMHEYRMAGNTISGPFMSLVMERALKIADSNACMRRIVASPTAGSCGVVPAVLLSIQEARDIPDEQMVQALYVAGGIGGIIASRATLAGAEGGCQAEVGAASAMAAGALVSLLGGSAEQTANAAALALKNLLGLACDPVAGLVEVPCVKRNVVGAVNAISAADMTMAGIASRIPPDEVIDAMRTIGRRMDPGIRETGTGGLAATPTAERIRKQIRAAKQGS